MTLNLAPDAGFVASYPTLRFWYARNVLFPAGGEAVDVPASVEHYIEAYASWYAARRHARDRIEDAERDWRSIWQELVKMDHEQVDWAERYV